MTKRTPWPLVVPAGTKTVGTARVRDDARPTMTTAQRRIYEATGNHPQVDSSFDEIADRLDPFAPVPLSMAKPKRTPKYRNTRCEHNGIKFDSEKERSRWFHLIQLQAAGVIRNLQLQVPFVLTDRKQRDDGTWERVSKYVADFVYFDVATGKQVVEDVKSVATRKNRTYIQKRKQMLEKYDITIKEV
ncbi:MULTISPECIES: DUF1064 domain-containing protein [Burkholderia cepacia complex]|uniref:DUF1064 domain-containing protein n=1 Tax=Burkholderia ubonensis TaxID=101571 RepID=A0A1B4LB11_9BURK|nr:MULTISPECIES: DUF1064 domain-containing protein [Burkholderia cepacia complex]AOJ74355.1 hypothetical protein WJ35_04195 [Burkholderia ubonensis]AOK10072.1 hypothetical protein WK31_07350 [Burkholderia vietnamiensis]